MDGEMTSQGSIKLGAPRAHKSKMVRSEGSLQTYQLAAGQGVLAQCSCARDALKKITQQNVP